MREKLYIVAAEAAATGGDLQGLWRKWVEGKRGSVATVSAGDEWRGLTDGVVMRIARLLGPEDVASTGLILATTKGDIEAEVAWMRGEAMRNAECGMRNSEIEIPTAKLAVASVGALPTLGSEAGRLARIAQIGGPAHAVSTACTSGISAIVDAAVMLRCGEAQRMIVVGADVATSFVREGFGALKALAANSCKPFDKGRDGLMVVSGAAALVIAGSPTRGFSDSPLAAITGYGLSSDAKHMTAPDAEAKGLMRAIRGALEMARLTPADVDVIVAHGTGTRYNDAMEAAAIRGVFLGSGAKGPAVTAVKGLVGHTLGASGVLEVALAATILREQVVPGIVGLKEPEFAGIDFVMRSRKMEVRHVMKIAAGFGGFNAAVVLSAEGA